MADEIEDLFAQLRKAMQRREKAALHEGILIGEQSAIDNMLAAVKGMKEHPLRQAEAPVEVPDAAFLRTALAERAAEEPDLQQCESCDARLPIGEMHAIAEDSGYYCPKCVEDWKLAAVERPPYGCPEHQYMALKPGGVSLCINCGHPDPLEDEIDLPSSPESEVSIEHLDRQIVDEAPPAEIGAPAGQEKTEAQSGDLTDSEPVSGQPPAADFPYWNDERKELLRGLISGKPTEAELLAAFPGKAIGSIAAQCYSLKLDPPTKGNFERWAFERGKVASDASKISLDDLITALRIAGDVVLTLDDPICELFQINGRKVDRNELLSTVNRYRRRQGKDALTMGAVVWKRKSVPQAPAGSPVKAAARQAAK